MAIKLNLDQLSTGHYQLVPDSPATYAQLKYRIDELGLDCIPMPPIVTDYLLADSVLREAAFDLENRGITGAKLESATREIYQAGYFEQLLEQRPSTLSVGEQQLLAVSLALKQVQPMIVGQYCLDFLSEANFKLIEAEILANDKVFIDVTQRNYGRRWQLEQTTLLEIDVPGTVANHRTSRETDKPSWTLSFQDLSKRYDLGNFELKLADCTIAVEGIMGIVGGNGSGKSTLGRCIAGLLEYSGKIDFNLPDADGNRIGYLIQQAATPTHGVTLNELIDRFALELRISVDREHELRDTLSDSPIYQSVRDADAAIGYRLAIAAILLAGDYDMVILDEPTYGLPSAPTAQFIRAIHEQFGTVPLILISHDSNFLADLCNTFLKLRQGNIDG